MQTLREFVDVWAGIIDAQSIDVTLKVEAGKNMSRFLNLEPKMRQAVDALVAEYAPTLSVSKENLSFELVYLFHLRLQEALLFARFLAENDFDDSHKPASEWILFLALDSWEYLLVHKWRFDFLSYYGLPK